MARSVPYPMQFSTIESAFSTLSPPLFRTAGSTSGHSDTTCCCLSGMVRLKKPDHVGSAAGSRGGDAAAAAAAPSASSTIERTMARSSVPSGSWRDMMASMSIPLAEAAGVAATRGGNAPAGDRKWLQCSVRASQRAALLYFTWPCTMPALRLYIY